MTVELIQGLLLAFALVVILMPPYIRLLRALGFGKRIREEGPESHHIKEGTPTMGGLPDHRRRRSGSTSFLRQLPDAATFAPLATLAPGRGPRRVRRLPERQDGRGDPRPPEAHLADRRRGRGGLADPADLRHHGHRGAVRRRRHRRSAVYIGFAAFAIVAAANGVNLTDGLDGLAGGTLVFAFVAFMLDRAAQRARPRRTSRCCAR